MNSTDMTEQNGGKSRRGMLSSPLAELHNEVDRLFGDFLSDARPWYAPRDLWGAEKGEFTPNIDVSETDKAVEVTADLPGIDEKDVEITLSNGVLTIKGERKTEKEEKDEETSFHKVERSYGLYQRSIAVPAEVDENKVKADYTKGVLTITLPKIAKAKPKVKKISIK